MTTYTATYSPDDNKLRLYASQRLDAATYEQARALGFRFAPKQDLFVCPRWTPAAEDFLVGLAGEIGDEDTTLVERAEQRAERFEDYSDSRAKDAESARALVERIAGGIPMGQPILIGHHSEKHARKDAERIESGMRRAVKMWDTAEYWTRRAAGAVRAAAYKERPDVRARRIKRLEAELRATQRTHDESAQQLKLWNNPDKELTRERALAICNARAGYVSWCFTLADYPRDPPASQYEGSMSLWSALDGGIITPEQARGLAVRHAERVVKGCARWFDHYNNRLAYERAMLADAGGLETDKTQPEKGGAVKAGVWTPRGCQWAYIVKVNRVSVTIRHTWNPGSGRTFTKNLPFDDCAGVLTAAEVQAARDEGRLIEDGDACGFALLDTAPTAEQVQKFEATHANDTGTDREAFEAIRNQLKAGVQVVAAPQLFPTPREIAERMVELADIQPGSRVLEPSAGTGALIGAMGCRMFTGEPRRGSITAVEINGKLCDRLRADFPLTAVERADFLEHSRDTLGLFDVIVMNPPFENGADIRHIEHARTMLAPGGTLVALCANGPRQKAALSATAELYEPLPAGSFKEQGTMVNVALLVIRAEAAAPAFALVG